MKPGELWALFSSCWHRWSQAGPQMGLLKPCLPTEPSIRPKAAQIKTDDVVDLTLCNQLGGNGR